MRAYLLCDISTTHRLTGSILKFYLNLELNSNSKLNFKSWVILQLIVKDDFYRRHSDVDVVKVCSPWHPAPLVPALFITE